MAWHFRNLGGWAGESYQCDHCRANSYLDRSCPEHLKPGYSWTPEYKVETQDAKGDPRTVYYFPDGCESDTCPVAAITPESFELASLFMDAITVRECAGTSGLARMIQQDARMFDAAAVIQRCRAATKVALQEALRQQHD